MTNNENLRTVESLAAYVAPDDVDIESRKVFLSNVATRILDDIEEKPPHANDITIHWGNKATYNRHKAALEVQDAGNMRALAREFVRVVEAADAEHHSTEKIWSDEAVVLFVNKFESLCRSEARFSAAYAVCQEKAGA